MPYAVGAGLFALSLFCMFMIRPDPAHGDRAAAPSAGGRWSTACATSATTSSCSARSRSICSRSCSAARRRCCRSIARDILHVGADRARPSARRAGGRRDADRSVFSLPAAEARCRREDARRGRPCSARATIVFGLSRWMALSLACLAVLGAADMLSRLCPPVADPALHARRDARPGRRRLRRCSSPRRTSSANRERLPRGARRPGGRGRRRRHRRDRHHAVVGEIFPELRKARRFDAPEPELKAAE